MDQKNQIFSDIVTGCHASIYRICLAYLYDSSHADDLYQEIMLQVWKSLDKYKGDAKVNTWVYRIAVNTAITYNLKHKRAQHEALPATAEIIADQGRTHELEEQLTQLRNAIHRLEEQDRLIISLVLEDLSYKEIAELTSNSVTNIGVKINRIKTRIMKLMENPGSNGNI